MIQNPARLRRKTARLFIEEHIMTPSELDNWNTDTPVWTPYRPVQH
ncbi:MULTISPECIES: hypothetical protein [Paraburkholderia]|nr:MULTISPECIES: hypothetical protein [Paraburkholderia]MDH6152216.1 hypothetical protein [Paraburkholderia sp. WSM4179]